MSEGFVTLTGSISVSRDSGGVVGYTTYSVHSRDGTFGVDGVGGQTVVGVKRPL